MPGSVASGTPYISITNKMQRYKIFFITVNTVHVSGVFSANHQELKTVRTALGICQACLLLLLAIANTFLYYCKCSTCFRRFSAHHQELKTVRTASDICQACLLLSLAIAYNFLYYCQCSTCFRRFLGPSSGSQNSRFNSPALVIAVSKLDIYPTLCVQF